MPKDEEQDVTAGAKAPAETALEKYEREQLTRRQALKKFGITSAMATFALFSVDDLARMVGKAMQQRAGDNKIAAQVAQEFQNAGIALAGGNSCIPNYNCGGCAGATALGKCCAQNLSSPNNCCINATWPGTVTSCQNCCTNVTNNGNPKGFDEAACQSACTTFWNQHTA